MAGAGQNVAGLAIPNGTVSTGYRAEDTLSALDRLTQAYREGIVGYQDLMGLIAKPAEITARMDQAKDASSAAKANMQVRPLETADKIGELGSRAQLRPKITALESAKLDAGQKDVQFDETIRSMKESVATGALREQQSGVDTADATRADRAASAKSVAKVAAVKAAGDEEMAAGDVANAKTKQQIDTATLERELKDPYKRREALVKALTNLGVDFDPAKDSDEILTAKYREASKASKQSELDMERAKAGIKEGPATTAALRKEVQASEPIKQMRTVDASYKAIEQALQAPSGVSDLTTIYSYIKTLDPDSVVKEGEIRLAQEAIPLWDRMQTRVSGIVTGRKIPDDVAQDILASAKRLRDIKAEVATKSLQPILEQINQQGLDPKQVFGPAEMALLQSRVGQHGGEIPAPGAQQAAPAASSLPPGVRKVTLTTGQVVYLDQQNKVVSVGQ